MAEHPEPRTHKRVRLLRVEGLVELATIFLSLVPTQYQASSGEISFDLFRTFKVVVKARHRDNETFVAICCIDKVCSGGACTDLSRDAEGNDVAFHRILEPGEVLMWKDDAYYHYTSPLEFSEGESHRDAMIVTIS